jgi:hypothetical protein
MATRVPLVPLTDNKEMRTPPATMKPRTLITGNGVISAGVAATGGAGVRAVAAGAGVAGPDVSKATAAVNVPDGVRTGSGSGLG